MKKCKLVLLIITLTLPPLSSLFSQSNEDMLIRYWYYRSRFKNHFINLGTNPGESLPISTLFGASSFSTYDPFKTLSNNKINDNTTFTLDEEHKTYGEDINVADLDIGWYTAVLATEYRLLKNNNRIQELQGTLQELYYALQAMYRLDAMAEVYEPWNSPNYDFLKFIDPNLSDPNNPYLNGFLMREDFMHITLDRPSDQDPTTTFLEKINDKTSLTPIYPGLTIDVSKEEVWDLFSKGTVVKSEQLKGENTINNDMIASWLLGLVFIDQMMHNEKVNISLLNGTSVSNVDLSAMARELGKRMVHYAKSRLPESLDVNSGFQIWPNNVLPWVFYCPDGKICDRAGSVAYPYATPLGLIGARFGDLSVLPTIDDIVVWEVSWQAITLDPSKDAWNTQGYTIMLEALSDAPLTEPKFTASNVALVRLMEQLNSNQWGPFWSLLHIYLHANFTNNYWEGTVKERLLELKSILQTAPCEGTHFLIWDQTKNNGKGGDHDIGGIGRWNTKNTWQRPACDTHKDASLETKGCDWNVKGFYAGWDYMLAHNLYYLMSDEALPQYANLRDRYLDSPEISPITVFGTTIKSEFDYNALYTITSNSHVKSGADVEFRAGKKIVLKSGFKVEAGSKFHAYIDPFECNANNVLERPSDSTTQNDTPTFAYGFTEQMDTTHHRWQNIEQLNEYKNILEEVKLNKGSQSNLILSVSPNPTRGELTVTLPEGSYNLQLTDVTGKIVADFGSSNQAKQTLDISHLENGMYFLKIYNQQTQHIERVVVQK